MIARFDPNKKKGANGMKHHPDTFETVLEQLEQIVENIEPGSTIKLADIIDRFNKENGSGEVTKAAIMLLKKYGITYTKG